MPKKQTAGILYGKDLAEEILLSLRAKLVEAEKNRVEPPGLAVLKIGEDPASALYVRTKKRACQRIGVSFHEYCFCDRADEKEILETIDFLNNDPSIFGIIVQLPLPRGLNTDKIIRAIAKEKDVDGFHPENMEAMRGVAKIADLKKMCFPPVILAVMTLLSKVNGTGREKVVIISRNEIFADPLADVFRLNGLKTERVAPEEKSFLKKTRDADIIIIAIGNPGFLKKDMVKDGAIIIDVGTTLVNEKLIGDVDFKSCEKRAGYISPVPGGVGPLTVAFLLKNVVEKWEK